MEIIRTKTDPFYKEKSRFLGNCFNVLAEDKIFHYEFIIHKNTATIHTDEVKFIPKVIEEFRLYNKFITEFRTKEGSFYQSFEPVHTFKLPISILQPSQFFINNEMLEQFEQYLDIESITIPVEILNDEYVCLDGHHRLYYAYMNDVKMVDVYLDTMDVFIPDFVYFAKEQNIFNIKDLKRLSKDEYVALWLPFCDSYFKSQQ